MHIMGIDTFYNEQEWDNTCKKLASQIYHGDKNSSKSFTLSADGVLQMHGYIHGLKHYITIAPHSLVPIILHVFYDSQGH